MQNCLDNYQRWKLRHGPKPNLKASISVESALAFVPAKDNVVDLLSRSEKVKLISDNKKLKDTILSYQQQHGNAIKLKAAITKLRNENKVLLDKSSGPGKKPSIPCPKSSGFKVSMLSKAYSTEPKVESTEVANSSLLEMLLKRNISRPQECSADDISLTRKRMLDDRELAHEDAKRIQLSKERHIEFDHRMQENVNISDFSREMARKKQLETERQNSHVREIEMYEQMKQLLALKQRIEIVKSFSSNSTSSFQSEEEIEELLTALATKKGSD